jgi:Family of unknown function (DUF6364)
MCGVNLTLSVDDVAVERAREAARQQGTSLNALIRRYIEALAGRSTGAEVAKAMQQLWREHGGRSGGQRIRREDAYEARLD